MRGRLNETAHKLLDLAFPLLLLLCEVAVFDVWQELFEIDGYDGCEETSCPSGLLTT